MKSGVDFSLVKARDVRTGSKTRTVATLDQLTPRSPRVKYLSPLGISINSGHRKKRDWRRERDSNPRYAINVYTLSRRALSTAQPPLRSAAKGIRVNGSTQTE